MVDRASPPARLDACPECGGDVHTEHGETACADCGLIVADNQLDHGPERDALEAHRGPPRTAASHDHGLGTPYIGRIDRYGNDVNSFQLHRLRKQHNRARYDSKAERNLAYGMGEIRRLTTAMGKPASVREAAAVIFRRAQNDDLLPGRSLDAMAAGSVVAALRVAGLPAHIPAVADYARADERAVRNAYHVLNRDLSLPAPPPTVSSHLPRIASAVDLDDDLHADAVALARAVDDSGDLQGCNPAGVAAACVYLAATEAGGPAPRVTQTELAAVAGTTMVTIRNARQRIRDSDEIDI